jgi:hypothetical protein
VTAAAKKQIRSIEDYQIDPQGIITEEDLAELEGLELTHDKKVATLGRHQATSLPKEWTDEQGAPVPCRQAQSLGPADRWNFLTPGPNKYRSLKAGGKSWPVKSEPWPGSRTFKIGQQKVVFRGLTTEADDVGKSPRRSVRSAARPFRVNAKPKILGYKARAWPSSLPPRTKTRTRRSIPVRQLLDSEHVSSPFATEMIPDFEICISAMTKDLFWKQKPPVMACLARDSSTPVMDAKSEPINQPLLTHPCLTSSTSCVSEISAQIFPGSGEP